MNLPVKVIANRGYKYIPAVFQYSSGIAALPGFKLHRIRFARLVPMIDGFRWIENYLTNIGRPLTAFAACELRSALPFSQDGFKAFNTIYADTLRAWGIFEGDDNPVARSNVCPELNPPAESGFYAFTFVAPDASGDARTRPSFVIAGGAETNAGATRPEERIVAYQDVSRQGMERKVNRTLDEMSDRLAAFDLTWRDTTVVQAYTVFDIHPFFLGEITRRGAAQDGLLWHPCRPPVKDVDFEMDCRGLDVETIVTP
jgi:hypothetical protein